MQPVPSSSLKEAQFLLARRETALAICHASSRDGTFRDLLGAVGKVSNVPIIVCGDFYDPRLYLEAMELGAFDYVTYPYHSEGVKWIVGKALLAASHKTRTSTFADSAPRVAFRRSPSTIRGFFHPFHPAPLLITLILSHINRAMRRLA
jgi:DNA-binding NtrC family response regulator